MMVKFCSPPHIAWRRNDEGGLGKESCPSSSKQKGRRILHEEWDPGSNEIREKEGDPGRRPTDHMGAIRGWPRKQGAVSPVTLNCLNGLACHTLKEAERLQEKGAHSKSRKNHEMKRCRSGHAKRPQRLIIPYFQRSKKLPRKKDVHEEKRLFRIGAVECKKHNIEPRQVGKAEYTPYQKCFIQPELKATIPGWIYANS
ncbi:hypothetical protein SESBI_25274 [Sesbania bispinosa]|nr:hypothetical protein SESBI_25274 [Sesbania bispinosa]